MSLAPGTRLGIYEITAKIGEGGMGHVYRARDTKLDRDVAIKVLPESFALDADRVARFTREAKTLAALNHPNIAAIYGVEANALVMELVEGEDLAGHIARGPIPLDEALPIARQIADAIEAAHEQGIIHRDLKPANIKVRADGTVKVLDFGLAKAIDAGRSVASGAPAGSGDSGAATMTSPAMTAHGVILGTASYMSPEQARGKVVDKRADIWAFGAVLYEMLTGRAAFPGDNVTDVLSGVVSRDPDWSALPASTPESIRRLLVRSLEKDPRRRLRDIGDARLELALGLEPARHEGTARPSASVWTRFVPWFIAAGFAAAFIVSLSNRNGVSDGAPVRRFTVEIPAKSAPNWNDFNVAISNDGTQIVYNCRDGNSVSLCARSLDSLTARRIAEARDASEWFFSPDAQWVGIVDEAGLSKVSIRGGEPQPILRWSGTDQAPFGFVWGADDTIFWGSRAGIQRVRSSGGAAEALTHVTSGSGVVEHAWPTVMPDGRHLMITIVHADRTQTAGLVTLKDGTVRDLGIRGERFVYLAPGRIAIVRGTTLSSAEFDPESGQSSEAVPVLENVRTGPYVASDGTLAYIPTRGESTARLVWVDRDGRPVPVEAERLEYTHLDLASDGRHALLNLFGSKIDLIDLQNSTRKEIARGSFPIWSLDGRRVTFSSSRGIEWAPVDGSAPSELLVPHTGFVVATSWNTATGELAYYDHRNFEIWIRSPAGAMRKFIGAPGRKRSGRFSPDGKWMAFVSDETGQYQVYVTAYPGPGSTVPISTKGGLSPIWSDDGQELFFRLGEKVLAVRRSSQAPSGFTAPVELFDGPYTLDLMGHQREDVAKDGKRFLMVENSDDFPIVIVQNWPRELGQLVRR